MSEPVRLRDDPAVGQELRDDLAAVSSAPVGYDAAAGLERLQAAIRGGGGGGGSNGGGATGGGGGAATWIAGGAIVAAIVAGAIWMMTRPDTEESASVAEPGARPMTSTDTSTSTSTGTSTDTRTGTDTSTSTSTSTSTGTGAAEAAESEASETDGEAGGTGPAVATSRRPAPDDDRYRREIAQLDEARRALGSDPARALRLASAGQREFPRGMYGEERAAIRIVALARLGRLDEARRLGEPFLRRHPHGTLSAEVRRAIGPP
jgi:hypothetical protein